MVWMQNVANVWVLRVLSEWAAKSHVYVNTGYRVEVRDSDFRDASDHGGGGHGYGVELILHTTDALVQNNVFRRLRHAMMVHVGASGNVFGYNYSRETRSEASWEPPDISIHGHYPSANLFEGNVVQEVAVTDFWGPAGPHNLFFRNRVEQFGVSLADASHRQNIVGNELIGSGITRDRTVDAATLIVHGNSVNGVVSWDSAIVDRALPDSYYLVAKPDFFGDMAWPSTGSDRPEGTVPAKSRYLDEGAGSPGRAGRPAISGSGNRAVMRWTDPVAGGTPAGYVIIARATCDGPVIATRPVGNVVWTPLGVADGVWCLTVRAVNAAGAGPESDRVLLRAPIRASR